VLAETGAGIVGAMQNLIGVLALLPTMPPAAQGLVGALVLVGLMVLRLRLLLVLLAAGLLVMSAIGGPVGTAFFLLLFLTHFKPMREFWRSCASSWRSCTTLPDMFPRLPHVPSTCDWDVCQVIERYREQINVVGICVSGSAAALREGAGAACAVVDRGRREAAVVSFSLMFAAGGGISGAVGAMVSTASDVWGLSGYSAAEDLTAGVPIAPAGGDINRTHVGGAETWVFSLATSSEFGFSWGDSWSYVLDVPIAVFGPQVVSAVCGLATLAWGHC
jgi:hypothetical protein